VFFPVGVDHGELRQRLFNIRQGSRRAQGNFVIRLIAD